MSKYKNSAVSIYYQIEYLNQFSQPYQNTIVLVIKQLMPMEIGVISNLTTSMKRKSIWKLGY